MLGRSPATAYTHAARRVGVRLPSGAAGSCGGGGATLPPPPCSFSPLLLPATATAVAVLTARPPDSPSACFITWLQARALTQLGHEVMVIAGAPPGSLSPAACGGAGSGAEAGADASLAQRILHVSDCLLWGKLKVWQALRTGRMLYSAGR